MRHGDCTIKLWLHALWMLKRAPVPLDHRMAEYVLVETELLKRFIALLLRGTSAAIGLYPSIHWTLSDGNFH